MYEFDSVQIGTKSIALRGSILWNSTPDMIKNSKKVSVFGKNIKNWTGGIGLQL